MDGRVTRLKKRIKINLGLYIYVVVYITYIYILYSDVGSTTRRKMYDVVVL